MHHTKNKGDLGVSLVLADLVKKGFCICLPISEHMPFDLIALDDGTLTAKRIQVKYRTASATADKIDVDLRSTYTTKTGITRKPCDLSKIDAIAIYCPNNEKIYYVPTGDIPGNRGFSLRLTPAKNKQKVGVLMAEDFRDPSVVWSPR